jgi:uncharacterized phage-associated protein
MRGFKVRKAAQVAAFFAIAEGGSINVLKLVKLVYLADRLFMKKYDCPILNDHLVSMPHGPVNSMTYSYIDGCEDGRENWDAFISDRANHIVALANPSITKDDLDELSKAELRVLSAVATEFKHKDGYWMRNYTHQYCPEWEDPHGSSAPIPYERVLKYLGKKHPSEIAENIETERKLDRILVAG